MKTPKSSLFAPILYIVSAICFVTYVFTSKIIWMILGACFMVLAAAITRRQR